MLELNSSEEKQAFKDILDICVLPTWWQQFEQGPHIDVMPRHHILLGLSNDFFNIHLHLRHLADALIQSNVL